MWVHCNGSARTLSGSVVVVYTNGSFTGVCGRQNFSQVDLIISIHLEAHLDVHLRCLGTAHAHFTVRGHTWMDWGLKRSCGPYARSMAI